MFEINETRLREARVIYANTRRVHHILPSIYSGRFEGLKDVDKKTKELFSNFDEIRKLFGLTKWI